LANGVLDFNFKIKKIKRRRKMKKLSVICLVIVFGLVFSQNVYPNGYGIKAGVNFADISNLENPFLEMLGIKFGTKIGVIAGAFYRIDLTNSFAIQPEVYYSQKGTRASGKGSIYDVPYSYDFSLRLDYIEIPLLMKYRIPTRGKFTPGIFAGPYVAFKVSAKAALTVESEGMKQTQEVDIEDVKKMDFGLAFGANLDFDIGHSSIIIDIRYSLGLSKISEYEDDPDMKNSAFTLMLGYAFK
jgi:hypothetical protein